MKTGGNFKGTKSGGSSKSPCGTLCRILRQQQSMVDVGRKPKNRKEGGERLSLPVSPWSFPLVPFQRHPQSVSGWVTEGREIRVTEGALNACELFHQLGVKYSQSVPSTPTATAVRGRGVELKGLPWTDWRVVKRNEPLLRPEEAPGGVATGGGVLTDFPHSFCPFMANHIQRSQWIPLGDCG